MSIINQLDLGNFWNDLQDRLRKRDVELFFHHRLPGWVPRILVVLLDVLTGVICTGSTQAACLQVPILRDTTREINRERLGESYVKDIDACHKNYSDRVEAVLKEGEPKGDEWFDERISGSLYDEMVNDGRCKEYDNIPVPEQNGRILCWAFYGHDFKAVAPCLRCQRLYREWMLNLRPKTKEEKSHCIKEEFRRYTPRKDNRSHCCAETVAGSKLYILRNNAK